MKKIRVLFAAFLLIFAFAFAGCQSGSTKGSDSASGTEEAFYDEELVPLDEEELAMLENSDSHSDEELVPLDEEELLAIDDAEFAQIEEELTGSGSVEEDGTYTSRDDVADYIYAYGHLPSNYITKSEAQELGWNSSDGNLAEVAPGMSIGGDKYGNYEGMLPVEEGRTYWECDVDYEGGYRNEKRLVYSNDGLIFYTDDHYETFTQIY